MRLTSTQSARDESQRSISTPALCEGIGSERDNLLVEEVVVVHSLCINGGVYRQRAQQA